MFVTDFIDQQRLGHSNRLLPTDAFFSGSPSMMKVFEYTKLAFHTSFINVIRLLNIASLIGTHKDIRQTTKNVHEITANSDSTDPGSIVYIYDKH